jgi:hypothetical protein
MPSFPTYRGRPTTLKLSLAVTVGCAVLGCTGWVAVHGQQEDGRPLAVSDPVKPVEVKPVGVGQEAFTVVPLWTEEQTPADFLEAVGLVAKARWRQLYRPPPPTPAPDRMRTSVTLGYLVGESYLCVQAADVQQFRNNNQEVMAYSRTLGFGEKVAPMLLAMAKTAEMEMWDELRVGVIEGYQALERSMLDQRDEDLAVLLKLGVWLRTLEVVSSVVLETPEADYQKLCVGSPALIGELRGEFATLPESVREGEVGKELGSLLDFLWRNWGRPEAGDPTQEVVQKTHERLAQTARKVSLR